MNLGETYVLDGIDRQLLDELQSDCKRSLKEIGAAVGLSAPSVMERVRKLENAGIIKGYHALLDARTVGLDISAFIGVSISNPQLLSAFEEWVDSIPQVLECHHVTGSHTLLLKVKTQNTKDLEQLISRIRSIEGVASTETMVVLSTHTERVEIALPPAEPPSDARRRKRPTPPRGPPPKPKPLNPLTKGSDPFFKGLISTLREHVNMKYGLPEKHGLYDPANEKDACGVGFVAQIKGVASHQIVKDANRILCNMDHRGARGSETNTGDGAGMLTAVPDKLLRRAAKEELGIDLPEPGRYGVGNIFLPTDDDERAYCKAAFLKAIETQGQKFLGWRVVPTDPDGANLGPTAGESMPHIEQLFIGAADGLDQDAFDASSTPSARAPRALSASTRAWSNARCSTRARCRAGRSSTRACSHASRYFRSTETSPTPTTRPISRWCTRVSRPTRSLPGSARSRFAASATTARSTR